MHGWSDGSGGLPPEEHVPVAANTRIAGPLIAWQHTEAARLIIFSRELLQVSPERVVDLEIIRLMAGGIQEGFIAGKIEIMPGRRDADAFAGSAHACRPSSR